MGLRVGVLISGEGTNLQAILDTVHRRDGVEVVCVGSSFAGARGIERAHRAGVDTAVYARGEHRDRDAALASWLEEHSVDLVVLAGFMEVLGGAFVRRFEGRIVNVHPSLLPAFPGIRAIERALEEGVGEIGVSVHFVDEGVDTGPIILQESFDLPPAPELARVEQQVHEVEHLLLPRAIRLIAEGAVSIDPDDPRRVRLVR